MSINSASHFSSSFSFPSLRSLSLPPSLPLIIRSVIIFVIFHLAAYTHVAHHSHNYYFSKYIVTRLLLIHPFSSFFFFASIWTRILCTKMARIEKRWALVGYPLFLTLVKKEILQLAPTHLKFINVYICGRLREKRITYFWLRTCSDFDISNMEYTKRCI